MFNESMQGINTLSFSLLNSVNDIIESNSFESVSSDRAQFITTDGDVYFPMSERIGFSGTGYDNTIPKFMIDGNSTTLNTRDFESFKDKYISRNITTISYNKSICLPTLLRRLAQDEKTYGLIIQKGDYMVNPLHPLIAFSITSGMMQLPEEGELHVFEWNDRVLQKFEDGSVTDREDRKKFYEKEYKDVFGLFKFLIKENVTEKRTATVSDSNIKRIIDSPLLDDINIDINIDVSTSTGRSTRNIKSIIVPTQLAIGNIATPYYGMMIIQDPREDIKGLNLTPMLSGNLNQCISDAEEFRHLSDRSSTGNVCTGSESSSHHKGWATLSKVNLNSMFNDELVSTTGVIPFVEASKDIAAAVWEGIEKAELQKLEDIEADAEAPEEAPRRTITVEE